MVADRPEGPPGVEGQRGEARQPHQPCRREQGRGRRQQGEANAFAANVLPSSGNCGVGASPPPLTPDASARRAGADGPPYRSGACWNGPVRPPCARSTGVERAFIGASERRLSGKTLPPGAANSLDRRCKVRYPALHVCARAGLVLICLLNVALQLIGASAFDVCPFALPVRA